MIKIEIPLKANPNSVQRRMAGNIMMRNRILDGNKKIVDLTKLKEVLLDALKDYEGKIAIHEEDGQHRPPLFSLEIKPDNYSSVANLIHHIEREYLRRKMSFVWISFS